MTTATTSRLRAAFLAVLLAATTTLALAPAADAAPPSHVDTARGVTVRGGQGSHWY